MDCDGSWMRDAETFQKAPTSSAFGACGPKGQGPRRRDPLGRTVPADGSDPCTHCVMYPRRDASDGKDRPQSGVSRLCFAPRHSNLWQMAPGSRLQVPNSRSLTEHHPQGVTLWRPCFSARFDTCGGLRCANQSSYRRRSCISHLVETGGGRRAWRSLEVLEVGELGEAGAGASSMRRDTSPQRRFHRRLLIASQPRGTFSVGQLRVGCVM